MTHVTIPYQRHSQTSKDAAKKMEQSVSTIRAQIYAFIKLHTLGITDEEGTNALEINPSTYRPRRIELQRMGLIKDSGYKRKTASNRMAVVWCAI